MSIWEILNGVAGAAARTSKEIYLVGGFLRDLYLGIPGSEIDFTLSGDALSFSRQVAGLLGGTWVPLDRINSVARVVLQREGKKWEVDFSSFKGASIEEDLGKRDFTINAMAVKLKDYLRLLSREGVKDGFGLDKSTWRELLIDPYGGTADIESKVIRAVNNYVFEADPVRILRGIRLAAKLNFCINPETLSLMEQGRWLLPEVAGERVREEIFNLLALPESYQWLALMDAIGVLAEIFPFIERMKVTEQNHYHADNVWVHSFKTYRLLEELIADLRLNGVMETNRGEELREKLCSHIHSQLLPGRRRYQLLKLAALFHDAGKVDTCKLREDGRITFPRHYEAGLKYAAELASRLKMSRAEENYLKKAVLNHMYPLYLFINQPVAPAAVHRFFTKLGKEATDVLLLSLADVTATYLTSKKDRDLARYRTFIGDLLQKYHFEPEKYVCPPALVKGSDIMENFGVPPSKKLGEILRKITEAQVRGEIGTKEEALRLASRLLGELQEKQ